MPIYQIQLLDKQEIAKDTVLFTFEKPAGLVWKPGQYGGFTLINPKETDEKGITRRFSILSIPDDDHILIATRIQNSAYKRVLNDLPINSLIKFAGPTGNFVLHEDTSIPAVLIAGGIGITPFYSMVRYAIARSSPQQISLFYGNQSNKEAAFLNELQAWQKHPSFKLIAAMAQDESWQGEKGFIDINMLQRYIPQLSVPKYYICGSPVMVTAIKTLLINHGIREEQISIEDFPGY